MSARTACMTCTEDLEASKGCSQGTWEAGAQEIKGRMVDFFFHSQYTESYLICIECQISILPNLISCYEADTILALSQGGEVKPMNRKVTGSELVFATI